MQKKIELMLEISVTGLARVLCPNYQTKGVVLSDRDLVPIELVAASAEISRMLDQMPAAIVPVVGLAMIKETANLATWEIGSEKDH